MCRLHDSAAAVRALVEQMRQSGNVTRTTSTSMIDLDEDPDDETDIRLGFYVVEKAEVAPVAAPRTTVDSLS